MGFLNLLVAGGNGPILLQAVDGAPHDVAACAEPGQHAGLTARIVAARGVPLEDGLAAALRGLREVAAEATEPGFADFWDADALERRPLLLIAAVDRGETRVWVMEPDPDRDAVPAAEARHEELALPNPPAYATDGDGVIKTKLLDNVAHLAGWLLNETTGLFPAGHERAPKATDRRTG